jgi:hypothetical protein
LTEVDVRNWGQVLVLVVQLVDGLSTDVQLFILEYPEPPPSIKKEKKSVASCQKKSESYGRCGSKTLDRLFRVPVIIYNEILLCGIVSDVTAHFRSALQVSLYLFLFTFLNKNVTNDIQTLFQKKKCLGQLHWWQLESGPFSRPGSHQQQVELPLGKLLIFSYVS